MELSRQIEFDKKHHSELITAIEETTSRFNEVLELVKELNERLGVLREDKKDFAIRIKAREQLLNISE